MSSGHALVGNSVNELTLDWTLILMEIEALLIVNYRPKILLFEFLRHGLYD